MEDKNTIKKWVMEDEVLKGLKSDNKVRLAVERAIDLTITKCKREFYK
jgi:hypothetical protein